MAQSPIETWNELRKKKAWASTLAACVLVLVGQALSLKIDAATLARSSGWENYYVVSGLRIASVVGFLFFLFILTVRRARLSLGALRAIYLAQQAFVLWTIWISQARYVAAGTAWDPMGTYKLILLVSPFFDLGGTLFNALYYLACGAMTVAFWIANGLGDRADLAARGESRILFIYFVVGATFAAMLAVFRRYEKQAILGPAKPPARK